MELSNYLVSWVVTYLGDLQPTYIGVIIYLLIKFHGHPSTPRKFHSSPLKIYHTQKEAGSSSFPMIFQGRAVKFRERNPIGSMYGFSLGYVSLHE